MQDSARNIAQDRPSPAGAYMATNWLNLIIDAAIAWWSRVAGRRQAASTGEKP